MAWRKLEQLRKGEAAGLTWGAPRTVSRRDVEGPGAGPAAPGGRGRRRASCRRIVGVPSPDGGYILLRISKVTEAEAGEQGGRRRGSAQPRCSAQAQYQAYVASLRSRADIEIRMERLTDKK